MARPSNPLNFGLVICIVTLLIKCDFNGSQIKEYGQKILILYLIYYYYHINYKCWKKCHVTLLKTFVLKNELK